MLEEALLIHERRFPIAKGVKHGHVVVQPLPRLVQRAGHLLWEKGRNLRSEAHED